MRGYAIVAADANHHLFEIANVSMHIAPVWTQIENRISNDLSGAVIRHITAAAGVVHLDAVQRELPVAGSDMRTAITPDAESNHRRMLEKDQEIGDAAGATLFDKRLLQIKRLPVRNEPESAYFEGS
jgi:hypothetical protein